MEIARLLTEVDQGILDHDVERYMPAHLFEPQTPEEAGSLPVITLVEVTLTPLCVQGWAVYRDDGDETGRFISFETAIGEAVRLLQLAER